MFGYIAPSLKELSEDQRRTYRRTYCGLCHAVRKRFGSTGGLSLSNDMTFLALLLSSLYDPECRLQSSRCSVHPFRSHEFVSSSMIDYAADMNILLFYLRCRDQRQDHDSLTGTAAEKLFRKKAEQVRGKYPDQSAAIEGALDQLWKIEKSEHPDPDTLCNLSGQMLGAAFVPIPEDIWSSQLYSVGVGLGRFVYWRDAWEDYDSDERKGRFNPLRVYHDRDDYESFCRETMEMLIADAASAFEFLPLEKDLDILRNILYSGVWQRYTLCMKKRYGKEEVPHDE